MTEAGRGKVARAAQGDYDLIDPLDYLLLAELPANGTTLSGLYSLGTSVLSLKGKFPELDSNQLSSRMRVLHLMGLVKKVQMVGGAGKSAWQRSPEGDTILDTWKEQHGNT